VLESTEVSVSELLVQLAERVHESFSAFFLLTLHLDTQNPKLQEAAVAKALARPPSIELEKHQRAAATQALRSRAVVTSSKCHSFSTAS
jgi:hypothetical protein